MGILKLNQLFYEFFLSKATLVFIFFESFLNISVHSLSLTINYLNTESLSDECFSFSFHFPHLLVHPFTLF